MKKSIKNILTILNFTFNPFPAVEAMERPAGVTASKIVQQNERKRYIVIEHKSVSGSTLFEIKTPFQSEWVRVNKNMTYGQLFTRIEKMLDNAGVTFA